MKKTHLLGLFLALGLVFVLSACSSPVGNVDGGGGDEGGEVELAVECSSPSEELCSSCLQRVDADTCVELSWGGLDTDKDSLIDPWYNVSAVASCDSDLLPCAKCLKRDKAELENLLDDPNFQECDCAEINLENLIDPCFMPFGCECLCTRHENLSSKCSLE